MTIAIIGAGVAGLSAASDLKGAGHEVVLFDKGRGAGGRLSTRRASTPAGDLRFDHGAQFFTARDTVFRALVSDLETRSHVAKWTPSRVSLAHTGGTWSAEPLRSDDDWFVGAPSMNSLVKGMAEGHDVRWGERAIALSIRDEGRYVQLDTSGWQGPFDAVILAIPAEQTRELLADTSPVLASEAAASVTAPCWAVMLAFDAPIKTGWDVAEVSNSPLSLVVRNSSKPGRGNDETFVLHATPEWTRANVDKDKEKVAEELSGVFCQMTGAGAPSLAAAHRWLYAKTETPANSPYGWDHAQRIGIVGDWRIAPRIEAAWQSGHALAAILID
ncbi:FAD-dependent oxidoreductase [Henriciella barbarensis]|uniref:FAD-dependent oxidoreductase n=1 Tax=Henriciella barbarensis TaxID=86342 RepID=A0A399R0M7_9PROT|nr:FAD-dependent oxidoreductase [Henriciella barbarensis]RIJ23437.1 FAD-dependent oxidoreductase [Henriciella barbarensis]